MAAQERKREAKFFYTVFSAWDYGVNDYDSIILQQKSVKDMLLVKFHIVISFLQTLNKEYTYE